MTHIEIINQNFTMHCAYLSFSERWLCAFAIWVIGIRGSQFWASEMRISISYGWFMHVWISEVGRDFIWVQIVKNSFTSTDLLFLSSTLTLFFWEDLFFREQISNARKTLKNLSKPSLGIMNHCLDSHKMLREKTIYIFPKTECHYVLFLLFH